MQSQTHLDSFENAKLTDHRNARTPRGRVLHALWVHMPFSAWKSRNPVPQSYQ
jgi:hypothetical protein